MDNFFTTWFPAHREVTATNSSTADTTAASGASYTTRIQNVGSEFAALAVPAYYRGVDLISGTIAQLPIEYLTYNQGERRFMVARGPRANTFYKLWNVRPNRFMSAYQMKKRAIAKVINKGYAVIYIERDVTQEAVALYLIESASYNSISETWSLTDTLQKINKISVPATDVVVLNNSFVGKDGLGISTIAHARQILTQSATLTSEAINRAATGGRTKAIISNSQQSSGGMAKYSKKQLADAKSDLQKQIDAGYDVYEIAGDVKVSNLSLSAADLQFIESQKFSVMDIGRMLGVPLSLLMEATNNNYKSGESSDLQFYTHCIAPRMEDFICELNCKMILPTQFATQKFAYDHSILHHMDLMTLSNYQKILIETGQASPNDLRRKANLAPIEGGDTYYVSTNLAVVNSQKLSGETTPAPSTPNPEE